MSPEELKHLRKKAGLTQKMFAQQMGICRTQYGRLETGKTPIKPSNEKLIRLLTKSR